MNSYAEELSRAVAHFWSTRKVQTQSQGNRSGRPDRGARSAVTGGKQMDGFLSLVQSVLVDAGLPDSSLHIRDVTVPGYFRPAKDWDLLVVAQGHLIASIEFKSQVGPSFGNNYNNRVEEAIGSATDLWTAFEKGKFGPSLRPWLGWIMLLEDCPESQKPVSAKTPHFDVFEEFKGASYALRYELFCQRLIRRRIYDATCFIVSPRNGGDRGAFTEPNPELSFATFAASLTGQIAGFQRLFGESW